VNASLLPVYARANVAFDRGEGAWLIAETGERWLDFGGGIAVSSLGHAHPHLVEALKAQVEKLWHTSNLYRIPAGERLAQRLAAATFADLVFFTNSGAEALECAIKMARRYHAVGGHPERYRLITFEGAFHGRTLATIAAGGSPKYLDGFGPKVEGFDQVPLFDRKAVEAAIGPETAGILIEPIQGEGGIRAIAPEDLRWLRQICDDNGILLIFDEVQTGVGRTGKLFAYEWVGATPDILSTAKGIGGGFPMGVCLATTEAARGMTAGVHGSTFGGNPLAMAAGNAVLDVVLAPGFLEEVGRKGIELKQRVARIVDQHPTVFAELRGEGLMLGMRCRMPATQVADALFAEKLLVIPAGENVLRLLPPLVATDEDLAEAIRRIERAAARLEQSDAGARGAAE